jgi:hypothetical protein
LKGSHHQCHVSLGNAGLPHLRSIPSTLDGYSSVIVSP